MANPYCKNLKTIIFDIETMGLYPAHDMIINAGFCDPQTGEVFQLFAESIEDEKRLINDINEILSRYECVITYNGDRFDIPFVNTRAAKHGLKSLPLFWSIDLYKYLKKYWPMAKKMQHLNQKSVEYALGLADSRDDKIGGGECIPLYSDYLKTHNNQDKELILLHNADDVRQLNKIYQKLNFLPYDQIAFERGFGILAKEYVVTESSKISGNMLTVKARKNAAGIPSMIYNDNYELSYDCLTGDIELKIRLFETDTLQYVDLNSLPVDKNSLKDCIGYHSDFLVITNKKVINYYDANLLIDSILSKENLF